MMKLVSIKLKPFTVYSDYSTDRRPAFQVRATSRNPRYPYRDNPIGVVAQNPDGTWSYSSSHAPHLGAVYGKIKTKERAAQECYKSHRSWVGY